MEIKELPAKEILLSPLNLLHTLFVVLVPGLLVIFLLAMKHSPIITAAESLSGTLGYKTKVAVVLFFAFVVGKVVQSVVVLAATSFSWMGVKLEERTKKSKSDASKEDSYIDEPVGEYQAPKSHDGQTAPEIFIAKYEENQTTPDAEVIDTAKPKPEKKVSKLTPSQKASRRFFIAFALGALMSKESRALDPWETNRVWAGLSLCSGLVLLAASPFPGDGLRIYELVGGILLTIMGVIQSRELNESIVDFMGQATGRIIAQHTVEENLEILQMTSKILPVITQHINPTPGEEQPIKIVEEIAEQSVRKPVNSRQRPKKKRQR